MATTVIVNRGTGAGGKNTNKNGLGFEKFTSLDKKQSKYLKGKHTYCKFKGSDKEFICVSGAQLFKYMKSIGEMSNLKPAKGCKRPDEAYIDNDKNIFIIEKKYQRRSGSVEEKIQTGDFKQKHFNKLFPKYNVNYIYCLNEWFKTEFESKERGGIRSYLEECGVKVFWGERKSYKTKIIKYMINYKLKPQS